MASDASNTGNEKTGRRTLGLAVMILLAFFAFYGLALVSGIFFSSPDDYSGVEKVASTLGPLSAGVIGYYFGQRPIQSLTEQVQDVALKKEKVRETLEETSDKTSEQKSRVNEQVHDLEAQVRTKEEIITRLSRALEQQRQQ
jgi:hypothetical protein